MPRRTVDNFELERWRGAEAAHVLSVLGEHSKGDSTFRPRKAHSTTRWNVTVDGLNFELLCTGARFFDMRAQTGGCGAVDLAMHLLRVDFKSAVALLRSKGL